jgi:hypothetical protein
VMDASDPRLPSLPHYFVATRTPSVVRASE